MIPNNNLYMSPLQMSETGGDTTEVVVPQPPPAEILPAKSEDKLEIEKEEQEEANKEETVTEDTPASEKAADTPAEVEAKEGEDSGAVVEDAEKKADKKKFSLPKVKAPKVLTELRSKSKERKKVRIFVFHRNFKNLEFCI